MRLGKSIKAGGGYILIELDELKTAKQCRWKGNIEIKVIEVDKLTKIDGIYEYNFNIRNFIDPNSPFCQSSKKYLYSRFQLAKLLLLKNNAVMLALFSKSPSEFKFKIIFNFNDADLFHKLC